MNAYDPRLARVIEYYESMSETSLAGLGQVYAGDALFKDPFNEVRGLAAIGIIFRHMYVQVEAPRFVVKSRMAAGDEAFLTWHFLFRMKGSPEKEQCIHGASHLRFDSTGLVADHRDYWDAAEELYEKIPVLGSFMRWLKRQATK